MIHFLVGLTSHPTGHNIKTPESEPGFGLSLFIQLNIRYNTILHLLLQPLALAHNVGLQHLQLLHGGQAAVDALNALAHDQGRPP